MSSLLPTTAGGTSAGAELVTSDGRSLALVSARLVGEAQGGLARLVLEQQFHNAYAETLNVTYRMPLPADGAISGYAFVIGDRTVRGEIDKKRQARERFERALVEGRTAALLEQERADIFTQQVGNIPPHATIVARITVDQRLAWLPEGEWELRFPTVIGPRYIGSADTAADARATHIKVTDRPLAATIQIELAIRDAITAGAKPSSPSHTLTKREDGILELGAGSRLDRDIVVRWPVAAAEPGLSLAAARPSRYAPTPAAGDDAYALLSIVPPSREVKPVSVPRDLIVLLDTSGSMSGGPLDQAKHVVAMLIDSLDDDDRLELVEFSSSPRRYLDEPVRATAQAKQAAIKWVRSRVADGGTEMRAGVIEALTTLRVGAQRQVIVVTDGYVGGEQQILEALNRRLPASCRLHVLGVGSAVNRSLATSLARAGRGTEVIVGIDEDPERGAKRLLDRTRSPVLTNVEISGSAVLRHAPARVPDVFAGAPLVCALAIRPEGGEIRVRGQLARDTWEQRITVKPLAPGEGNGAIVQLYGRERVADVEATALFASVDGEVEDLGLTFQIATRMTSWVAIDEVRREVGPTRDELVPQELPYGTSASAFGLRAPSTMQTRAGALLPMGAAAAAAASATYDGMLGDAFGEDADDELAAPESRARPLGGRAERARMAPPPPAGARAPRAPAAPPPARTVTRMSPKVSAGRAGLPAGDDFAQEEPTGKLLQAEDRANEPRDTADLAAPASASPAEVARRAPRPAQQPPEPVAASAAPPVTSDAAPTREQEAASLDAPKSPAAGAAPQRSARAAWPWLAVAALLAVIALLIWWLAR